VEGGRVGHGADAYAVEDDPDDPAKHKFEGSTRRRAAPGQAGTRRVRSR
jgi:hypothetical protein